MDRDFGYGKIWHESWTKRLGCAKIWQQLMDRDFRCPKICVSHGQMLGCAKIWQESWTEALSVPRSGTETWLLPLHMAMSWNRRAKSTKHGAGRQIVVTAIQQRPPPRTCFTNCKTPDIKTSHPVSNLQGTTKAYFKRGGGSLSTACLDASSMLH